MNKRLEEIRRKNTEFERESPYNHCDRWCERCTHEKQMRCKLYQDEFEQRITCIAHGKDEYDPEITAEVMKKQYESIGDLDEEELEEIEIDFDRVDNPELEMIKHHIKFVENNSLDGTADQYHKKAHLFLKNTFYKEKVKPELAYDFETISWYHTLLPAKIHRALCGFHEPATEGDFALYDAVAQFDICSKGIEQSIKALQNISNSFLPHKAQIAGLIVLLHNLGSRIKIMVENI